MKPIMLIQTKKIGRMRVRDFRWERVSPANLGAGGTPALPEVHNKKTGRPVCGPYVLTVMS